jgi:D-erythro-7,8-dihydroneopterin triphosphate epimerase
VTDRIFINDLGVRCIIGINEEERRKKQDVLINLALSVDLARAGRSDRFEDTVDYRAIKREIVSMVEDSSFFLVEALAEAVADLCLKYPGVLLATVRVEKPGALRFARSAGVEITRPQRD